MANDANTKDGGPQAPLRLDRPVKLHLPQHLEIIFSMFLHYRLYLFAVNYNDHFCISRDRANEVCMGGENDSHMYDLGRHLDFYEEKTICCAKYSSLMLTLSISSSFLPNCGFKSMINYAVLSLEAMQVDYSIASIISLIEYQYREKGDNTYSVCFFYSLSALSALPISCANFTKAWSILSPDNKKQKNITAWHRIGTLSYALLAISLIGIPDGYNAPSEILVSWCLIQILARIMCVCDRSVEINNTVLFQRQPQPPSGPGRGQHQSPRLQVVVASHRDDTDTLRSHNNEMNRSEM